MKLCIYGTSHIDRLEKSLFNIKYLKIINLNKNKPARNKLNYFITKYKDIISSDALYCTFCGLISISNIFIFLLFRIRGKVTINHWIGSDVLAAKKHPNLTKIMQILIKYNFAGSELLATELNDLGINSTIVPIVLSDITANVSKMPKNHAVLVYLPSGQEKFYGIEIIKKLAEQFRDIKFFIVANDNKKIINYSNVAVLGKVSPEKMESIYDTISILIRIPEHDGLSMMVLEALAKGKSVIYKYVFPYTYTATDYFQAFMSMQRIISMGDPQPNYDASKYINSEYTTEKYVNKILEVINA